MIYLVLKNNIKAIRSRARNYFFTRQELICLVWFMVFNATFNNISVISWRSVLFVGETGIPGENHRRVTRH